MFLFLLLFSTCLKIIYDSFKYKITILCYHVRAFNLIILKFINYIYKDLDLS